MRPTNVIGLLSCVLSLNFAYFFLEKYLLLIPCPLCILDRIVVAVMGLIFLAGLFAYGARARTVLLALNVPAILAGLFFAGRHVWLQNQPLDSNRSCLSEDPEISSITEFLTLAFDATTDCGAILWNVFGLSIPGLTLILFIFLALLLVAQGLGIYIDSHADNDD